MNNEQLKPEETCENCGKLKSNGWRHAYSSGYGDFATVSCSAPIPKVEGESEAALSELLKHAKRATKEELKEQGESLSRNYKPGPRQAVPFKPAPPIELEGELPPIPKPTTNYVNILRWNLGCREEQLKKALSELLESRQQLVEMRGQLNEALETRALSVAGVVRDSSTPCGWRNKRAESAEAQVVEMREEIERLKGGK